MHIRLHVKCPVFLSDFNITLILATDFEKYTNIKLHEKEPSCSMRSYRRTDGHDEANSPFSQFCERA
jgi:hypothetical protein